MFPHLSVVYFSKMDIEQTVKDLQAQNSQFQQLLMTLAKGQGELKTLLEKEKEKNKKKRVGVATMGRRFEGQAKRVLDFHQHLKRGKEKVKELQCHLSLKLKKRKTRITLNNSILRPMRCRFPRGAD